MKRILMLMAPVLLAVSNADAAELPFIGSNQAAAFICFDFYGDVPNAPDWGVGNPVHCTSEHLVGICAIPKRKSLEGSEDFGGNNHYRWDEFYMNAFVEGAWIIQTEEDLAGFRASAKDVCENYPGKPGVWTEIPYELPECPTCP